MSKEGNNELFISSSEALAILKRRVDTLYQLHNICDPLMDEPENGHSEEYREMMLRIAHSNQGLRVLVDLYLEAKMGDEQFYRVGKIIKFKGV